MMATLLQSLCTAEANVHPARYAASVWLLAALALTACGGGDGLSAESPNPPTTGTPSTPPVRGSGKVSVTVRDVLQAPLAGARVYLNTYWTDSDQAAVADANGRAEFANVPEDFSVSVYEPERSSMWLYGLTPLEKVGAGEVKQVDVTASPSSIPAGGVAAASVAAGGISEDGRTLDLSVKVIQVRHLSESDYRYGAGSIQVQVPCVPDTSNDLPEHRSDCISGADEFDAPYGPGQISSVKWQPAGAGEATPYAAALLLDQSAGAIVDDLADARLFAAKYFLTYASADSPKALAAFASDGPGSAGPSLLPAQPVTFFPVEYPQFSSYGPGYFPMVDALGAMEGGGAPLYAALDQVLDFVAAKHTGSARAVVVISNGRDDTCGSRAECRAMRDAVVLKSRTADIAIVTIGVPAADGVVDREALGLLAQGSPRGAAFWAEGPEQLAMTVSSAHSYLAQQKGLMEVTFQIQSPVAGAFASGRSVLGTLTLVECPWDCMYTNVPYVVQIP
jgi:hypothetical protein